MRVDMLAVGVNESFRQAIAAEVGSATRDAIMDGESQREEFVVPGLTQQRDSHEGKRPQLLKQHQSEVTTGSRSIVIMDDTNPPDLPFMSGAIPPPSFKEMSVDTDPEKRAPLADTDKPGADLKEAGVKSATDTTTGAPTTSPPGLSMTYTSTGASTPVRPPSALRYTKSIPSPGSGSGSLALRRFASFQSGMMRHRANDSVVSTVDTDLDTISDRDSFVLERPPGRGLRRRPGGDLRALHHGQNVDISNRPRSTGSLSNRSHSVTNSVALQSVTGFGDAEGNTLASELYQAERHRDSSQDTEVDTEDVPRGLHATNPDPASTPSEGTPERRKKVSLVDTHSSQPNLRPSFEAEVAKLAQLPDDEEDDGGIASALLKLEGKFERRSPIPSPVQDSVPADSSRDNNAVPPHYVPKRPSEASRHARHEAEVDPSRPLPPSAQSASVYLPSGTTGELLIEPRQSVAESEDSYNSVPLLERGFSDRPVGKQRRIHHVSRSVPRSSNYQGAPSQSQRPREHDEDPSPASSTEHIEKTDSLQRIPQGGTMLSPVQPSSKKGPQVPTERSRGSSHTSSDLSTDIDSSSDGASRRVRSFYEDEPVQLDRERNSDILPHPLRLPPTPPSTADRLAVRPPTHERTVFQRGLPTPGLTPILSPTISSTWPLTSAPQGPRPKTTDVQTVADSVDIVGGKHDKVKHAQATAKVAEVPAGYPAKHLPFILAHDPEILAEQFTIIEKDALDEIDWKELIELRWKQSSPEIRDWVEYLRTQEPRGVDVVIARFNLVVKWALSEIVLCENAEERARCIVQYIHIADHARRFRNYATMYQLTVALLSTDCSRLKQTWDLVPPSDKKLMDSLEQVVQPLKNFHNLRAEMETAAVEEGCVPFIGIYTRDLVFNANKPAYITSPPIGDEPMINFERHHTAASIVKSLLRLLEASSKYKFQADPSIISKCLWMSALSDDEIAQLSRRLE